MNCLKFDVYSLELKVHANKEYPPDIVRHFKRFAHVKSSASGQYGSQNFPKLVKMISETYKKTTIYFVDVRQDTHFELNGRPASLKRIILNDDNSELNGEDVIGREKAVAQYFVGKNVKFVPRNAIELPQEQWDENGASDEKVEQGACVKDFVELPLWNGRHKFQRFALKENGPLTDAQVDEFLSLIDQINREEAWLHTNSIAGDKAAILLIVMKDMLENVSDSYEQILGKYEGELNGSFEIPLFLQEFYKFAQFRSEEQLSWSEWKEQDQ